MFRRKDENMFDAAMDASNAQGTLPGTVEPASQAQASQPSAPAAAPISTPQASAMPSSPVYQPQQSPLRQVGEAPARPAAASAAFRPASAAPSAPQQPQQSQPQAQAEAPAAPARPRAELKPSPYTPSSPVASAFSTPAVDKSAKPNRRVLTVGNDILLKGEIATCDRLVIEGRVDATLNDVHTVEIAETGSFKGLAHVEDAEISGVFEGELIVKNRLVIYSTGRVRGKITYGEIEIERGGELTGDIKTPATAAKSSAASPAAATRSRSTKDDKVAA